MSGGPRRGADERGDRGSRPGERPEDRAGESAPVGSESGASTGLADESAFSDSLADVLEEEVNAGPQPPRPAAPTEPASPASSGFSTGYGAGAEFGLAPVAASGSPLPARGEPAGASPRRSWVGKHLGSFKLLGPLGSGTMGMVIRALDVHLGRVVALKVLRRRIEGMDESQRVSQFLREARAAARIEHPCVATIYQIGQHRGWWYIASELVEAGSLHSLVRTAGPLPVARACALVADAASALAAAHRLGIVHRDIKPQNLLLARDGRCKVIDFGLVRLHDPNDPFDFTTRVVGTPLYVAPEVLRRQEATGASDVYGLACTLHFALTGTSPFLPPRGTTSAKEVARQHLTSPRPDVRARRPDCPPRLAALIQRAMAIEPAERPSAEAFEAALRVETIGEMVGASSQVAGSGHAAGLAIDAFEGSSAATALAEESALARTAVWVGGRRSLAFMGVAAAALAVIAVAFAVWKPWRAPPAGPSAAEVSMRYPDAPASYGRADGGGVAPRATIDLWTWKGRVDPGANRFVGVRNGRRAFEVDDPRALAIPAQQVEFFADEIAAREAGRRIER